MRIHLPADLIRGLSRWIDEPFLYLLFFLVIALFFEAYRRSDEVFDRSFPFPGITFLQIFVVAVTWLAIDSLVGAIDQPLRRQVFFFSRNLGSILLGVGLIGWLRGSPQLDARTFVGRLRPVFGHLGLGLGLGVGLSIVFAVGVLSSFVPFSFAIRPPEPITIETVSFFVFVILLVPFTEELLFRYYLFTYLRRTFGITLAVFASSLLFALAHGMSSLVVLIFSQAVVLAVLVESTRSLIAPIVLHAGYNFLHFCGGYWV